MKHLKLLTAPPLVMLYYVIAIIAAGRSLSFSWLPLNQVAGVLVAADGVGVGLWGAYVIRQAKTTIHAFDVHSATSLVTSGAFAYSRNPIYLGMVGVLLGTTLWAGTLVGFLLTALFMLYIDRAQIVREERALADIFGDEFATYKSQVRKWL